jgi:hypothetical protein
MSRVPPGSLKCVIAWSERRNLCSLVFDGVAARTGEEQLRLLGDDSFAVYTTASSSEIRDWAAEMISSDESVLVVEFEKWSGFGSEVPRDWLLARGH